MVAPLGSTLGAAGDGELLVLRSKLGIPSAANDQSGRLATRRCRKSGSRGVMVGVASDGTDPNERFRPPRPAKRGEGEGEGSAKRGKAVLEDRQMSRAMIKRSMVGRRHVQMELS